MRLEVAGIVPEMLEPSPEVPEEGSVVGPLIAEPGRPAEMAQPVWGLSRGGDA